MSFEHYLILEELTETDVGVIKKDKKHRKGNRIYSFARAAQRDGAYQYAKHAYELIIANYPESPLAIPSQLELAHCLESEGTREDAVAAYERFLQD